MSKPIITRVQEAVGYETVEEEWTYDRLIELFPDDGSSCVNPLVRRCQEYEKRIEGLEQENNRLQEYMKRIEDLNLYEAINPLL